MADKWLIWSEEHGAWWMPNAYGYTRSLADAGHYSLELQLKSVPRQTVTTTTELMRLCYDVRKNYESWTKTRIRTTAGRRAQAIYHHPVADKSSEPFARYRTGKDALGLDRKTDYSRTEEGN